MSKSTVQPSLFEFGKLYDVSVVNDIDGYDVVTSYGPEGSYVDVTERAKNLMIALISMSERNRRDGFSLAPYTEEYSEPIWSRYRWNTETVIDGASKNRNSYQQQLRQAFWRATGFSAIRGAGFMRELMPERQINPRAQKMWRDFNKKFGHPHDVLKRKKYKGVLAKQISDPDEVKRITADAINREAFEQSR